ncbi:MAG: hypothetical protein IPJ34_25355 [Myxococcales bacterium]|nr:hypothetical protein [Myxococcales bacterium]
MKHSSVRTLACALFVGPVSLLVAGCEGDPESEDPKADTGIVSEVGGDADTGTPDVVDTGTPGDTAKPSCLTDTSELDKVLALPSGSKKCLVGQYTLPVAAQNLSWGRHGGPLGFESAPDVALVRWKLPVGPVGVLTAEKQKVTVPSLPSGIFWSGSAIDLPFFGWTAFTYTDSSFGGELILTDKSGVLTRYFMKGFYGNASLGVVGSDAGRLLFTGLSGLATAKVTGPRDAGLWAADSCGTAAAPKLIPAGDATCKDPTKLATWRGGDSGLVTRDPDGNVFVVLATIDFTDATKSFYETRGFEKTTVARGQGATAGDEIVTLNGSYVSALAADGKALYYQPTDGKTYEAQDVKSIAYAVDATGKKVKASGAATTFLSLKKAGTVTDLFVDDKGALWVGVVTSPSSDAGAGTSTYFVLGEP